MPRSDLRALFRSNDRALRAVDYFADREGEWESVRISIAEHTSRVRDAGFDVEDLEAPRRNVLVFYGVGGIGKSTLSRGLLEHDYHRFFLMHADNYPVSLAPQAGDGKAALVERTEETRVHRAGTHVHILQNGYHAVVSVGKRDLVVAVLGSTRQVPERDRTRVVRFKD